MLLQLNPVAERADPGSVDVNERHRNRPYTSILVKA